MSDAAEPAPLEGVRAKQREVVQELAGHVESESAKLLALLRRGEDMTRQIALTEAQILRQDELHAQLKVELNTLAKRKAELDKDTKVLGVERDTALQDAAAAEQTRARLEAEVQQHLKTIKQLVKDNDDLQREVDKLESRRARLEESVEELRKAREEYLAKIESLKARQDALAPK